MKKIFLAFLVVFSLNAFADFAYDIPVSTPKGPVAVQKLVIGSKFIVAELIDGEVLQSEKTVQYSSGVGPYLNITMVNLVLSNQKELLVTPDHVFVLSNGKLILAEQLTAGSDLMGVDGNPMKVLSVSLGLFKKGQHAIAASTNFPEETRHFIISHGVISGDFMVQIFYHTLPDELKEIH